MDLLEIAKFFYVSVHSRCFAKLFFKVFIISLSILKYSVYIKISDT